MANSAFDSLFSPAYTNSIQDTGDGPGSSPSGNQSHTYQEQDGKHTGLAGVGRDILGTLGDFLLTRLHMPAMYAPAQKQRELNAAWQGHDSDPGAAADRVASVDFTKGQQIGQQQDSLDSLKDYRESAETIRQARSDLLKQQQAAIYRKGAAGSIQSLKDKDGNFVSNFAQIYSNLKPNLDTSFPGQNLPDPDDPNLEDKLNSFIGGDVGAAKQITTDLTRGKNESLTDYRDRVLAERSRHNIATEGTAEGNLDEKSRHNQVTEGQGDKKITISGANAVTGAANATSRAAQVTINAHKAAQYKDGMSKTIGGKTYVRTKGVWQPQ